MDASVALKWLIDLGIHLLDSTAVWPHTLEAALQWQVTTYDAVYVLTALDQGTELVTADTRLHASCSPLGLPMRLV
ncbi:type II toxin-antitoxin system VapC family toxin [Microlunatus endophyticus]|uniref:type II toxin-antitoxin system VapC family toxin n=1 Tax=Microlunatus endophyticus TaxID=1716077 RepID=UPI00166BE8C1|nr:type II toxin-antitoxin system VapC family toxin [Microlunatus endophyticus]